jgi:hypothetical protein
MLLVLSKVVSVDAVVVEAVVTGLDGGMAEATLTDQN